MEGRLEQYYMETLSALDPDQLVSDLRIESDEILEAFPEKAKRFIEREYGE
mgnify:CR=1 FL=1